MRRIKVIGAVVGLGTALALAVACGNGEAATTPDAEPDASSQVAANVPAVPQTRTSSPGVLSAGSPGLAAATAFQVAGSQTGISVAGEGVIELEPDLAQLNLGVEGIAKTVAEARDQAATAMNAIVGALSARQVAARDIQTRSFNISPQYDFVEVVQNGVRTRSQVLVGFRVSNSATAKIRDLEAVGAIIDEVSEAAGDAVRINGVSFTVEDPGVFAAQLREAAVGDALAKADHLASLAGVSLGPLVFITESTGGAPVVKQFAVELSMAARAGGPSPISGGELELRLTVQASFAIQ